MAEENPCPHCGLSLPANAPHGVCPRCLMQAGLPEDANATPDKRPVLEGPGTTVGRYELLELIGEGGMGLVYLAEQKEPIRRKVALKIVKLGMDTMQVVARFQAEQQTLAMLAHPNIAQVFDAGMTESGRPYFVMEYVEGTSITKYCDEHKLSVTERLELFKQVCEGVHHAHQKGIIHRDLKPSNVLVFTQGNRHVPKIIDFGVAKALTEPLADTTCFTREGQLLGTPEYMSPEQVDLASADIDTRSDIYSLGILLYELLAGVLPFDRESFKQGGFAQIQRTIQEEEPTPPSTRLTSLGEKAQAIAERRRTQLITLARCLHRELEWIPMKAIRKDRTRRYRSASELADDIQNYLTGVPLMAGPESSVYRARKFIRKHAGSVSMAALVAVVVILGLVASIVMGCRAEQARQQEASARKQVEQALARAENAERTAQEQRKLAEEQRLLAEQRAEEYRRSLYVHQITLADVACRDGDTARVRELLDSCPEDLRGWEWHRLHHVSDQAVETLRGDEQRVYDLASAPDGRRFASAGRDGTIRVWDARSGTELMALRGHENTVMSVAFSPDGKRIASVGRDKTIRVWDAQSGAELMTLAGDDGLFNSVGGPIAFSPDSKRIVSGAQNNSIRIWDVDQGTEIRTLNGHEGWLYCLAFDMDGGRIVSGSRDKTIRVWDVSTGKQLMVLKGHDSGIGDIAISPDGERLVSVSADKTAKLWDMKTGAALMTLDGHRGMLGSVAFSPDGSQIVTGGESGANGSSGIVTVWDAAKGIELITLFGHLRRVTGVAFSLDGKRIVSGSLDGTIRLWQPEVDHTIPVCLKGRHDSMAFSRDGDYIVTGGKDKVLRVWDALAHDELMKIEGAGGCVSMSPDGKRIISTDGNDICVWDTSSGEKLMTLSGHERKIWSVAYSPDGTRIVSGALDKTVRIWNADTGVEIMTLRGHGDSPLMADFISPVASVAFSPDGSLIASGRYDYTVKIWNATTGAEVMTMDKHTSLVNDVAFSPDGTCFASASSDGTVRVCGVVTGEALHVLNGHKGQASSIAFSPDGKRIVSGGTDETIRIWDATTGIAVQRIPIGGTVWRLSFSPDGRTLATCSESVRGTGCTITLWESAEATDVGKPSRTNAATR